MGAAQRVGGRLGAYRRWSRTTPEGRREATAKARAAFEAKFADAPNPEAARKAHFIELALKRHRRREEPGGSVNGHGYTGLRPDELRPRTRTSQESAPVGRLSHPSPAALINPKEDGEAA